VAKGFQARTNGLAR